MRKTDKRQINRRKVDKLLSRRGGRPSPLTRLLNRSSNRDAWTAQLRALLPEELGAECQVANVRDHVLSVHINHASWATRVRLLIPDLLPKLNQLADFAAIDEIRLRVEPFATGLEAGASHPFREPDHATRPNPPDQKSLTDLANDLEYDQLRQAVLRLASHGKVPTEAQSEPAPRVPGGRGPGPLGSAVERSGEG